MGEELGCSSSSAIDSSNVGFQLLKKHGWKEGTGLGVSEQGRLEPLQAYFKKNKRGLGADKIKKKKTQQLSENSLRDAKIDGENLSSSTRNKVLSKRMKKMQEAEKKLREKEFERAFFREFWPDNV